MTRTGVVGGIELGGTKTLCAIGTGPDDVRVEAIVPTTTPEETLRRAVAFFRAQARAVPISALGVASFGPLDLDPRSSTFGTLGPTPKRGWAGVDLVAAFRRALELPIAIDTDVNGAAVGEHVWGAARDVDTFVYVTVGTGLGGGGLVGGRPMHALAHPEMGHMRVPHDTRDDAFIGVCPFHGDCLEGLASAPALAARWGVAPETLPPGHRAWELEARYLALGVVNVIMVLSPQRIVIGGGIMRQPQLLPMIRSQVAELLARYTPASEIGAMDEYVVAPGLGDRAGVLGAIALAQAASSSA